MPSLPGPDQRTVVIGATGSGKTQFGVWLLSTRDFNRRVWFILDFKGERLFPQMAMTPWNFGDPWPEEPGLYWIRILPGEDEEVSNLFKTVYMTGNCGIFIDEGSMLPYMDKWVRACLTQGRSKYIEMVCLTQRPVRIDIYFFSEASYFSVFNLNVKDDKKRVSEFMDGYEIKRLPKYYSLWYNIEEQEAVTFEPCPPAKELIKMFQDFEEEQLEQENLAENRIDIL